MELKPNPLERKLPYLQLSCLHRDPIQNGKWWKSWMSSRFSWQKIGGRIATFGGRFLSNQRLEKQLRIGGRFSQFGGWFWVDRQLQKSVSKCVFPPI